MRSVHRVGQPVSTAVSTVFATRRYQVMAAASFLVALALYAVTLPATYTGGRVGMVSLRFLTPALAGFALVMAGFVSLVVTFMVYAMAFGASTSTGSAASGVVGSVLPPLLCCSPLLPTMAAGVAAVTGLSPLFAGAIQGFIATYELHILTAATLVLAYSVYATARSITTDVCEV